MDDITKEYIQFMNEIMREGEVNWTQLAERLRTVQNSIVSVSLKKPLHSFKLE